MQNARLCRLMNKFEKKSTEKMQVHFPRELTPGYLVPPVIGGGWQLSLGHALQKPVDTEEATRAFESLLALGLNTFDGADIYTGVEDFYGSIIRARRAAGKSIPQIHTKFVPDLNDLANVDYAYVEKIITRSCDRLGVERLDLVQFHWWDYTVPGMVDVAGQLVRLKEKGLIRNIATTNMNAKALEELLVAGIPVVSNQCQYSVLDRRPAVRLEAVAKKYGVKFLCYGSVAGGFLSEKWLGMPQPKITELENRSLVKYALVIEDSLRWEGFQGLLKLLAGIGAKYGVGISTVSMLYTLSRPEVAAAIVGTRNAKHVADLEKLLQTKLTNEDIAQIEAYINEFPTVDGDCFDLERLDGSKHRAIMRMNLVNSVDGH